MDIKRVFLAIPIHKRLSEKINEVQSIINCDGWKPTLQENLHITVHFFGNMKAEIISENIEKIALLLNDEACFSLHTDHLLVKKGGSNMIWLKIKDSENFTRIATNIKTYFQASDMRINPHITVGRFKNPNITLNLPRSENHIFKVNQIELWQSPNQTERPGYYKSLAVFKLNE